jgi:hypothetical protein
MAEPTGGARIWHQAATKVRQPLASLANFLAGTYEGGKHFEAKGQHAKTARSIAALLNRAGMSPEEAGMATRAAGVFNEEVPAALQALSGSIARVGGDKDPKGWRDMIGPSGYDDADLDENEQGIAAALEGGDQRNPYAALALEVAKNPISAGLTAASEVASSAKPRAESYYRNFRDALSRME